MTGRNPARATAAASTTSVAGILIHLLTISPAPAHARPSPGLPMVINTWGGAFTAATDAAYLSLASKKHAASALEAVEIGCATCERNQCDGSVGFGGSPDENCETTLDAMIMDGNTFETGAVAGLRRVKSAISVARHVLLHTTHSLLAGDQATRFAVESAGFPEEDLSTPESRARCEAWKEANCQPNYRVNVRPDATRSCGPYKQRTGALDASGLALEERAYTAYPMPRSSALDDPSFRSHDTISMIAVTKKGMAAGTSTSGATHKVPGRVGDGPIVGSGSYADSEVGGCGATGDGDIMMRFLPCYQAVENLRLGMSPEQAAEDAVRRMVRKFPQVSSGIVVVNNKGEHGAAASGWTFTYAFRGKGMNATEVVTVPPVSSV